MGSSGSNGQQWAAMGGNGQQWVAMGSNGQQKVPECRLLFT